MRNQQQVLNASRRDELRDQDILVDAQLEEQEVSFYLLSLALISKA